VFSSFDDLSELSKKLLTIINSENVPLNDEELASAAIIEDTIIIKTFDLINKINTENITLSDEDLARAKIMEKSLPEVFKVFEAGIKELEKSSNQNLQEVARNRRNNILKFFEPAKVALKQIIQKEETHRANKPTSEQLTSLQNQIKALEAKIRDDNSDPDTVRQCQQIIQQLKAELQKSKNMERERERERAKTNQLYSPNYWWRRSDNFLINNNLLSVRK